jgi:hypothetical protein
VSIDALAVQHPDLSITVKTDGDTCTLFFNGKIDMENPEKLLLDFFNSLHDGVVSSSIKTVVCDLNSLLFLNSRGMKSFVHWVMNVPKLPKDQQYTVFFKVNPDSTWQEKSIITLTYVLPEAIQIIK